MKKVVIFGLLALFAIAAILNVSFIQSTNNNKLTLLSLSARADNTSESQSVIKKGRIYTYYYDDDGPNAGNSDWWDNLVNNDYEPEHYQEVAYESGSGAGSVNYTYPYSGGMSGSGSYDTHFTGKWGVRCPDGDGDCVAISPG